MNTAEHVGTHYPPSRLIQISSGNQAATDFGNALLPYMHGKKASLGRHCSASLTRGRAA